MVGWSIKCKKEAVEEKGGWMERIVNFIVWLNLRGLGVQKRITFDCKFKSNL